MSTTARQDNKKYILIQNEGEIESNSFELIGASTKRGETGKIGFFGSGLKYSIAYMMRKGIDFKVFSGEQELVFSTIPETLKDQSFDRICINGKPTSYTVTMGPTWTEDWFVLREIWCNAIDESNCQIVKETDIVRANSGKTRIFIELTPPLRTVINNWETYFADEREPLFVCKDVYTCFLATEEDNYVTEQDVSVYQKTKGVLYRKGIKVWENEQWMYDYGVNKVDINEDRTAKNANAFPYAICDMFAKFANEEWIKNILRTCQDDDLTPEYMAISSERRSQYSDKWVDFSYKNLLVVKDIAGRFTEEISGTKKEVFLIPSMFARNLKKNQPEVIILGMGTQVDDTFMSEAQMTKKTSFLLNEVKKSLEELDYAIPYDITMVEFENDKVLGKADMVNKKIYLSKKVFDLGRREIAMTLIEECEHIKSKANDKTREFQNHLISQWLTTMENNNGLFL
jgi:hypothetical protein